MADELSTWGCSSLLNESSLEFYRGTRTAEQLKETDGQLSEFLNLLAPHLMLPATHKIIEYLVRIYEVHAHLKHDFVMIFLPYFETTYFLKAIQLVNVKDDEYFSFLHEFAYRGEQILKGTLSKALARNNAAVFAKYSDWMFRGLLPNSDEAQDLSTSNVHFKFFSVMLIEILLLD